MSKVLQRAAERIASFQARNVDAVRLARVASLAVRLDPPLLRTLRYSLVPDIDVGAEADLWFSPLVESCGTSSAVLDQHVVSILRESLLAERQLLEGAATVTLAVHASLAPLLRLEEQVTAAALRHGDAARDDIDAAFQPVLRTLADSAERGREIARWILRAAPRLPPVVWRAPNAYAVLARSSLLLDGRRVFSELPRNSVSLDDVAWALPPVESSEMIDVGVTLASDALRFVPGRRNGATIQIPAGVPSLVEVEWSSGNTAARALIEAIPGHVLQLGGSVDRVAIRTVAGDLFSIERARMGQPQDGTSHAWRPQRARALELGDKDGACVQVQSASGVRRTGFYIGPQTVATAAGPFGGQGDLYVGLGPTQRFAHVQPARSDDEVLVLEVDGPEAYADPLQLIDRDINRIRTARVVAVIDDRLLPVEATRTARVASDGSFELEIAEARLPNEFLGAPVLKDDGAIGIITELRASTRGTTRLQVTPSRRLRPAQEAPPVFADTPRGEDQNRQRIYAIYARNDRDVVKRLSMLLRAGIGGVWLDDTTLSAGSRWTEEIERQIQSADRVLVFVSFASGESEMMQRELALAIRYGKAIVPLLLERGARIPEELAHLHVFDVSNTAAIPETLLQQIRRSLNIEPPLPESSAQQPMGDAFSVLGAQNTQTAPPLSAPPAPSASNDLGVRGGAGTTIARRIRAAWRRLTGASTATESTGDSRKRSADTRQTRVPRKRPSRGDDDIPR